MADELSPLQASALEELGPLDGARLHLDCPGCDDCYRTITPGLAVGHWIIVNHHAPWCPLNRLDYRADQ